MAQADQRDGAASSRSTCSRCSSTGSGIVVKKFIEDGAKANIKRWMQAVEITACRAGLLLCGDLEIAKKIIAAEPQLPGDLPPPEKLKELIVFSRERAVLRAPQGARHRHRVIEHPRAAFAPLADLARCSRISRAARVARNRATGVGSAPKGLP